MSRIKQKAAFITGIIVVLLAISPYVSKAAEQLFSIHMAQHLLLIAVAAPLLALSRFFEWLPQSAIAGWAGFVGIFLFWHWPAAFQWAAQTQAGQLLEHGSILLSALLFWRVALAPENSAQLGHGARALYVMTAAIATDLPGVIMVFSPTPFCAMPGENATHWGLTPLDDQRIAGLLMWVPANLVFFSIATWLFSRWIADRPASLLSEHQEVL